MPTAAMYFSPLALVDRSTGMALRFSVGVACLCLALWLMHRMINNRMSEGMPSGFTLGIITCGLALQFLLIDFDDAGPHAILLGILIGAVYAVWRGHELLGGVLFGLSTALKVTPALFLPYFLWKRQWRLAGYMSVATLCWILLPITWMGPNDWWSHQREWTEVAFGSLLGDSEGLNARLNEERVQNSGLQQGVMHPLLIDFDDAGPHAILLGILIGAVYAVWRGHELLGGVLFGLSTALKVTPALFLPYFLWKRQWRLAGYMSVATLCWILLPITWMGPNDWWSHQREWTEVAFGSLLGDSEGLNARLNEERVQNSGLQQGVMRYLVTYPDDHLYRKNDPGYVPVLNVKPALARILGLAVGLGLLAFFAWKARHPYQGRGDPHWLWECSAVLILTLLLSPITWNQHLVWLVPGLYLIVVEAYRRRPLGKVVWGLAVIYVMLSMVLNYELLGRQNYALFLSWKPYTIVMLLVLMIVITWSPGAGDRPTRRTLEGSLDVQFNPSPRD